MRDPYEVLGVKRSDSDSEIKRAYHELVKKYHPDNYADNPLADLASEKMKEINQAYDDVVKERQASASASYSSQSANANSGYNYSYQPGSGSSHYSYYTNASSGQFPQIRAYINNGQLDAAASMLAGIHERSAEWYFLAGEIAYRRGWLDEARQNYQTACSMAPGNMEYRRAMTVVGGGYTPYRQINYGGSNDLDTACNVCNTLLCLNCLCSGGGCR